MKKGAAIALAVLLLLLGGCSGIRLPQAEPFEYDGDSFPHVSPKSGGRVNAFIEEIQPEAPETDVSPESYMEAVSRMTEHDYVSAAEMLSGMGDYRNANHLADLCRGITEHDFDKAVTAMQWVEALDTFTYDDAYAYESYRLESCFNDIFEENKHENSADALNAMLEAVYYARLSNYESVRIQDDALFVEYFEIEDSLLTFQNVEASDWMEESLLESCKGEGSGKVLIAQKGAGSGDSFKVMKTNMMYALPKDKIPKKSDEVEYVLFIDDDYENVGVYSNGAAAIRYRITFTVKRFPGGDVVYDSGLLIGDDPDETVYAAGTAAFVSGKLPDMTEPLAEIEKILGLDYANKGEDP